MGTTAYIFPGLNDNLRNEIKVAIRLKTKPELILKSLVARECLIDLDRMNVRTRKHEIVEANQIFCVLYCYLVSDNLSLAGTLIGRDHATVIHAKKTVANRMLTEKQFREKIYRIAAIYFRIINPRSEEEEEEIITKVKRVITLIIEYPNYHKQLKKTA